MNNPERVPTEPPDWAVVQEIHAIRRQGGILHESSITVCDHGKITIRREYKMPDGTDRIMRNDYPSVDDLTCRSDMFMLEIEE